MDEAFNEDLLNSLVGAHAESTVEAVFKAYRDEVPSITRKTEYLDKVQGTTKTYSTPGMSEKDKYEMSLEAFLDPIWRGLAE